MKKTITAIMTIALLLSAACERVYLSERREFTEKVTHADLNTGSVRLVVKPTDTATTMVEFDLECWNDEPEADLYVRKGSLYLDLDDDHHCDGFVIVEVPADASVNARNGSGAIVLSEIKGDVKAHQGSGDILLSRLSGDLDLEAGSGSIEGENLNSAACYASTGSGNLKMEFNQKPGSVDLHAGSGNVSLNVPSGSYSLDLEAGSGRIDTDDITENSDADSSITVRTGSGNINVRGE